MMHGADDPPVRGGYQPVDVVVGHLVRGPPERRWREVTREGLVHVTDEGRDLVGLLRARRGQLHGAHRPAIPKYPSETYGIRTQPSCSCPRPSSRTCSRNTGPMLPMARWACVEEE